MLRSSRHLNGEPEFVTSYLSPNHLCGNLTTSRREPSSLWLAADWVFCIGRGNYPAQNGVQSIERFALWLSRRICCGGRHAHAVFTPHLAPAGPLAGPGNPAAQPVAGDRPGAARCGPGYARRRGLAGQLLEQPHAERRARADARRPRCQLQLGIGFARARSRRRQLLSALDAHRADPGALRRGLASPLRGGLGADGLRAATGRAHGTRFGSKPGLHAGHWQSVRR